MGLEFFSPLSVITALFLFATEPAYVASVRCLSPMVCSDSGATTTEWREITLESGEVQEETPVKSIGAGPLSDLTSGGSLSPSLVRALCPTIGIKFEGKCFVPVYGDGVDATRAEEVCSSLGGALSNIYSNCHMDALMKYIRASRSTSRYVLVYYLGMTYNFTTRHLQLRNGTTAPPLAWHQNNPLEPTYRHDRGQETVFLVVRPDPALHSQKLYNGFSQERLDVLCEV